MAVSCEKHRRDRHKKKGNYLENISQRRAAVGLCLGSKAMGPINRIIIINSVDHVEMLRNCCSSTMIRDRLRGDVLLICSYLNVIDFCSILLVIATTKDAASKNLMIINESCMFRVLSTLNMKASWLIEEEHALKI